MLVGTGIGEEIVTANQVVVVEIIVTALAPVDVLALAGGKHDSVISNREVSCF